MIKRIVIALLLLAGVAQAMDRNMLLLMAARQQRAAAVWQPTDIAGCIAWWDASISSSVQANGNDVTNWVDQSSFGRNASFPWKANSCPTVGSLTGSYSKSSVAFVTNYLDFTPALSTTNISIFIVCDNQGPATNRILPMGSTAGGAYIFASFPGTSTYCAVSANAQTLHAYPIAAKTGVLIIAVSQLGLSYTNTTLRINGDHVARYGQIAGAITQAVNTIGRLLPGSMTTYGHQGNIYSIVAYSPALSTGLIAVVEQQLFDKWKTK